MKLREIKTYKIYTKLNNSHERTIRIQQSQHKNIDLAQQGFIGIHSYRPPKYRTEFSYKNKPCQSAIFGIYKKLQWLKIKPTKKECFRIIEGTNRVIVNCRLNGICGAGKCLAMKKILKVCNLCSYPTINNFKKQDKINSLRQNF
jgi:hypothetical protein